MTQIAQPHICYAFVYLRFQKRAMRINAYLAKSAVVAALGGLLFGFDTAVISGVTGALTTAYGLTPATLGLTVAAALWGTIIGAMFGGIPGDVYGRRASLRITGILYLLTGGLLGLGLLYDLWTLNGQVSEINQRESLVGR